MDDDGTRRGSGKGGFSSHVKASSKKLPHIKSASQAEKLSLTQKAFKSKGADNERQVAGLKFGIDTSKRLLRSGTSSEKREAKEFLSTARAFKIKNKIK